MSTSILKSRSRSTWITVGVLVAGLVLTGLATLATRLAQRGEAHARFEGQAERLEAEISRRIQQAGSALMGARATYQVAGPLNRDQFRSYVATRDLPHQVPGIRGFGFIERVPRTELDRFVARERDEGAPEFQVHPEGSHAELYVIKYVEPLAANRSALGRDIALEPVALESLQRAIRTGGMALSGRVVIDRGEVRGPGWILAVAVYLPGPEPATPQERQERLLGLVYAPVLAAELLRDLGGVLAPQLHVRLFDGAPAEGRLVFDSAQPVDAAAPVPPPARQRFVREQAFDIGGRTLTLQTIAPPGAVVASSMIVGAVALGGIALSLLLALSAWLLLSGRERALTLAHRMTEDLDRMARVVRHTSNSVFGMDPQLRILWVNEAFIRITGFTAEEAIGRAAGELLRHPKADPAVVRTMLQAAAEGLECRVEILNRRKDGSDFWVQTELQPMRDASGRLTGFIELALDITGRKHVEQRLRNSESFLAQAEDIAGVGGWELDLETGEVRISQQLRRLFELPPESEQPSVEDFLDHFDGDSRERIDAAASEAIRNGTAWDLELGVTTFRGRRLWMRTVGRVERSATRSVRLVGTLQDVTERKEQQAALQASENLMRVVTDNIPGRVAYWDHELRCRFVNRVYCETFGVERDQILGRTIIEIFGPERYHLLKDKVHAALRGEAQQFERLERDVDGRAVTTLVHYIPDQRGGAVHGFFVLALDVTELRLTRDLALQASEAKSQFLANMSHEIRTPMNAILGMLALLQGTELTPRQRDYADKTEGAARSLLSLLNDILDFSKIEAGKMTLDPRPFGIDDLLRDLSVILSANVGDKDLEVLFDVDPALPRRVVGDDMRLRQILINLGGNAIKFTPQGEVVVGLHVRGRTEGAATLEVSVRDTGIGIAPEHQARIFSDFSQAEATTTRRFGGTGLGLSISRKLAALMGGELHLDSTVGEGSRFSFEITLPVEPDDAPPPATGDVRRVLVVDDHPVARQVLADMCASLGWQAETADGGAQALELLQRQQTDCIPYDAVFVDWKMPGMDGWETSQRIREHPACGKSPLLVMVTAHGREMLGQRAASERALLDGFLVKPVTAAMLAEAVAEASGQQAMPEAPAQRPPQPLAGMRLLVVEDNPNNQQVARELLQGEGVQVDLAADGREGVARIAVAMPAYDAVLMDIQMPVMDGYAATRHVRRMGHAALPIIAMTANAMASDRAQCLSAGMNDHVGKPFDLRELVATLLRHTGRATEEVLPGPLPIGTASSAVLDTETAIHRMGGNRVLYHRLVPSFLKDAHEAASRVPLLLRDDRRDEGARLLHTLKGLAGTMGASELQAAAALAEKAFAGPPSPADLHAIEALQAAVLAAAEALSGATAGAAPAPTPATTAAAAAAGA